MQMKEFHYEHLLFRDPDSPYIFHRGCLLDKMHSFPAHWHESLEILYFYQGQCHVVINTRPIHVSQGDIICVNSKEIHYIEATEPIGYNTLIVSLQFLQKCGIYTQAALESYIPDLIAKEKTAKLYRSITNENKNKLPYYKSAEKAAVTTLIIHLFRNHTVNNHVASSVSNSQSHLIREALDYIHLHYLEDISTVDISNHLGITVNHLCASFKNVTSFTIKKYINSMRCHDAEAMLATGKYSVIEVGTKCGFSNMAYFAKTYRSIVGVNPSETLMQAKGPPVTSRDGGKPFS